MTAETPSEYWYRSPDGLVMVPASTDPGWETIHKTAGDPPGVTTAVTRRRATDGEFMFLMAKHYTVAPAHVVTAEALVREIYRQSYEKQFQRVDYGPIREVVLGGHGWWEAEMALTHERRGRISKIERTSVVDTNVFVLSAEGAPEVMAAHAEEIGRWLNEARFAVLERLYLRPARSVGPFIAALGGQPAADAAAADPAAQTYPTPDAPTPDAVAPSPPAPQAASATDFSLLATMASDGPPPGVLDTILLEQVLPVVQPHEWPERPATVHRSLCWLPRIAGTPWLGFQISLGSTKRIVMRTDLDSLGITAEALEKAAIRNLSRSRSSWVSRQLPGPGGKPVDVLFCQDSPHACERILERPFLLHGKAMLRAESLAATVPHRGLLVVSRFDDFRLLMSLGKHLFESAESPPVSPWVFAIQGGEITGRFFDENGQIGLDAVVAKR
jgi:hypothetical protein